MKNRGNQLLFTVFLAFVLSWSLAPFLWQVLTSLKPSLYLTRLPPFFPPFLTLAHYSSVLSDSIFLRIILNGMVVAILTTILSLVVGSLASFALACFDLKGSRWILAFALSVSLFPCIAVISPLYLLIRSLGLRDTWWALVLTHSTFVLPLTLWTLTHFFREVPKELYKAALIDGLTPLGIFRQVYLPLAKGGLAAAGILNFIFSWNEFLFALTFTNTEASRTVPVGIALFGGYHELPFGDIAAASTVVSLPVIVFLLIFQKHIVSGLTQGAVKG